MTPEDKVRHLESIIVRVWNAQRGRVSPLNLAEALAEHVVIDGEQRQIRFRREPATDGPVWTEGFWFELLPPQSGERSALIRLKAQP